MTNKTQWSIGGVLVAILIAALWYCVTMWQALPSMPTYGYAIMGVAVVLALVAGCGLTALMYYSQRRGYDEPARNDRTPRE